MLWANEGGTDRGGVAGLTRQLGAPVQVIQFRSGRSCDRVHGRIVIPALGAEDAVGADMV